MSGRDRWIFLLAGWLGFGLGCDTDSGSGDGSCEPGGGGCPCADGQCDAGLVCSVNVCVDASGDGDPSGDGDGDLPSDDGIVGVYLLALETSLGPDLPLQFVATLSNPILEGEGLAVDLELQPLSLDPGATTTPREFVDPPLEYTLEFGAEGGFQLDLGSITITGQANPVTGSDIIADLSMVGGRVNPDAFCGLLSGSVTSPLVFDLEGSTFAAIRLVDDGSNPETLPVVFPYRCDQIPA